MSEPPTYAEVNPPFPLPTAMLHRLRPIAEYPHGFYVVRCLAWRHGNEWRGMWGGWDEELGRFRADMVLHRTNALAGTPTHWVDDRG